MSSSSACSTNIASGCGSGGGGGIVTFFFPFCSFSVCSVSSSIFSYGFPRCFHVHNVSFHGISFFRFSCCSFSFSGVSRCSFSCCGLSYCRFSSRGFSLCDFFFQSFSLCNFFFRSFSLCNFSSISPPSFFLTPYIFLLNSILPYTL